MSKKMQTVKERRRAMGMDQRGLGKAAGMDSSRISLLENKKYVPTVHEQRRIATALDCQADELLFPTAILAFGINKSK